ncbi:MAG: M16 family metallopeptidase [Thiohalomonadales bacterium]
MAFKIIKTIVMLFSIFLINTLQAETYTANDLFKVNYYQLANGLEVYLKPRYHARKASIKIAVKFGSKDYPCETRETAHYLEHLLFTGTKTHTEIELDELFKKYGGVTNATTGDYQTTYEINVHSKFTISALNTYFEMLTGSIISERNVKTTKDIIYREGDGKSSDILRWLYTKNIFKDGIYKAYETIYTADEYCRNMDYFENITKTTILNAHQKYYVPNNMAVFVVGNFDEKKVLNTIKATFGKLKTKPVNRRTVDHNYPEIKTKTVKSTLKPLFSNEATVTFLYRVAGSESKDKMTLIILKQFIANEMYNIVRIKYGLSYRPYASYFSSDEEGELSLYADVEVSDINKTIDVFHTIINDLRKSKFSAKKLNKIKEFYLLNLSMGTESNESFASIYSSYWRKYESKGKFDDIELEIKSVTTEDLDNAIEEYLTPDKLIIAINQPSLTYTQLFILGILLIMIIGYFVYRLSRKRIVKEFIG